jgi:hypothetical protein
MNRIIKDIMNILKIKIINSIKIIISYFKNNIYFYKNRYYLKKLVRVRRELNYNKYCHKLITNRFPELNFRDSNEPILYLYQYLFGGLINFFKKINIFKKINFLELLGIVSKDTIKFDNTSKIENDYIDFKSFRIYIKSKDSKNFYITYLFENICILYFIQEFYNIILFMDTLESYYQEDFNINKFFKILNNFIYGFLLYLRIQFAIIFNFLLKLIFFKIILFLVIYFSIKYLFYKYKINILLLDLFFGFYFATVSTLLCYLIFYQFIIIFYNLFIFLPNELDLEFYIKFSDISRVLDVSIIYPRYDCPCYEIYDYIAKEYERMYDEVAEESEEGLPVNLEGALGMEDAAVLFRIIYDVCYCKVYPNKNLFNNFLNNWHTHEEFKPVFKTFTYKSRLQRDWIKPYCFLCSIIAFSQTYPITICFIVFLYYILKYMLTAFCVFLYVYLPVQIHNMYFFIRDLFRQKIVKKYLDNEYERILASEHRNYKERIVYNITCILYFFYNVNIKIYIYMYICIIFILSYFLNI